MSEGYFFALMTINVMKSFWHKFYRNICKSSQKLLGIVTELTQNKEQYNIT